MGVKRTEPSCSLLQGMNYVNAVSTDIRVRFAAIRAAEKSKPDAKKANKAALRIAARGT